MLSTVASTGESISLFVSLYCGSIALQAGFHYRDQLRFFRTSPSQLYGLPPRLLSLVRLPRVSEPVFLCAGAGFVAALALAAGNFATHWALCAALVCYLIYFPPILPLAYAVRKANLIPIVLAALILIPNQALEVVRAAVAMVYLSGGLEKLRNSGIRWANGRSLKVYLLENYLHNQRPQAIWLAGRPVLCRLLSTAILGWELSFWLVIVFPALSWVYVLIGLAFHAGTAITMRIRYWIYFCPAYFVFVVPWLSAMGFRITAF